MKIAVVGAGSIGGTIGRRWQEAGHQVIFGVRNPQEPRGDLGERIQVDTISSAIADVDAVLLAVPGVALGNLLSTHADRLDGQLLLDATNNVGGSSMHQLPLFEEHVPAARVFRVFNTLGWENFANPTIGGEQIDLFYAGPDGEDRTIVEQLTSDVGLRPVYVGSGNASMDIVDGVARLWFALALGQRRGRRLAFRLLEETGR